MRTLAQQRKEDEKSVPVVIAVIFLTGIAAGVWLQDLVIWLSN